MPVATDPNQICRYYNWLAFKALHRWGLKHKLWSWDEFSQADRRDKEVRLKMMQRIADAGGAPQEFEKMGGIGPKLVAALTLEWPVDEAEGWKRWRQALS